MLLSSVVLASVNAARQNAQMSKAKSEMAEFVKALEIYKTSNGHYPICINCLVTLDVGVTDRDPADTFSKVTNELKAQKIYSGDLVKTLSSIPNISYLYLYYTTDPNDLKNVSDPHNDTVSCNGITKYSNYYLGIYAEYKNNQPIDLENSYLSKAYLVKWGDGFWGYCSGN